ncbi:MAG: DUF721 domain-containing protein [Elusimicrobia bacterium]|nr:DUF721 domain-containing protein [Elusimicrobiota bacterium]
MRDHAHEAAVGKSFKDFMALNSLKSFFPSVLQNIGVTYENFSLLSLIEKEISGIVRQAKVVGFKRNKVYVEVESSVELSELQFRKREILETLRQILPKKFFLGAPLEIKVFVNGSARPNSEEIALNRRVQNRERVNAYSGKLENKVQSKFKGRIGNKKSWQN